MYTPDEIVLFGRPKSLLQLDRFSSKLAADARVLGFDMSPALPVGVSLVSADVVITSSQYTDDTPTDIQNGSLGVDTQTGIVTVPVSGGDKGAFYTIRVNCVTNSAFYKPSLAAVLPVV